MGLNGPTIRSGSSVTLAGMPRVDDEGGVSSSGFMTFLPAKGDIDPADEQVSTAHRIERPSASEGGDFDPVQARLLALLRAGEVPRERVVAASARTLKQGLDPQVAEPIGRSRDHWGAATQLRRSWKPPAESTQSH